MAGGEWTEARYRTADARVIQARQWIEYVRLFADSASADLEGSRERLEYSARELSATSDAARKALVRSQIAKDRERLHRAFRYRADVREQLHLDRDRPDGIS